MSSRASITVMRRRADVERLWRDPDYRHQHIDGVDAQVRLVDAPGDRGTEIHVELAKSAPGGKVGEGVAKLLGGESLAKVKDDLQRFKQLVETGVVARSDGAPEGEVAERKLGQRSAQPLEQDELQKVGV